MNTENPTHHGPDGGPPYVSGREAAMAQFVPGAPILQGQASQRTAQSNGHNGREVYTNQCPRPELHMDFNATSAMQNHLGGMDYSYGGGEGGQLECFISDPFQPVSVDNASNGLPSYSFEQYSGGYCQDFPVSLLPAIEPQNHADEDREEEWNGCVEDAETQGMEGSADMSISPPPRDVQEPSGHDVEEASTPEVGIKQESPNITINMDDHSGREHQGTLGSARSSATAEAIPAVEKPGTKFAVQEAPIEIESDAEDDMPLMRRRATQSVHSSSHEHDQREASSKSKTPQKKKPTPAPKKEPSSSPPKISWKLPEYEATHTPPTDTSYASAKVSLPGMVREEIILSPDHSAIEFRLIEHVLIPSQRAINQRPTTLDPKLTLLNFHTITVLVLESFVELHQSGGGGTSYPSLAGQDTTKPEEDADEVFLMALDKWRVGKMMKRENYEAIRGIQEFCDVALEVVFWVLENGVVGEVIAGGTGGKGKRKVRSDKGTKRGPRIKVGDGNGGGQGSGNGSGNGKVNVLAARKKDKGKGDGKTAKGSGMANGKGNGMKTTGPKSGKEVGNKVKDGRVTKKKTKKD